MQMAPGEAEEKAEGEVLDTAATAKHGLSTFEERMEDRPQGGLYGEAPINKGGLF